jgi:ABC-type dipeptide/oligopeptide/nickel transport system permease subunit
VGRSVAFDRFVRNRSALAGLAVVTVLATFAVAFPWVSSHDPFTSDFVHGISASGVPVGPGRAFLLGTDRIFRDELVRLAYGARLSLVIAISATALSSLVGGTVGIVSGYYEGTAADVVLMRVVDVGLAFPFLLLVMAIGAALGRTTPVTILVVLGLTGWLGSARIVRAKTIQVRAADFIVASRALGQSTARILLLHILPNVAGPITVLATLSVAQMIVAESVLSYLGAGVAPPTPTWGHMLLEGQDYMLVAPWTLLGPAVAILVSVIGFNLIGEGLRDALDPRQASGR